MSNCIYNFDITTDVYLHSLDSIYEGRMDIFHRQIFISIFTSLQQLGWSLRVARAS